jgi:hypothetical protein
MKLNELLHSFTIYLNNEEAALLESLAGVQYIDSFNERERIIIENLVRKSLVTKIHNKGSTMVVKNDFRPSS